MFKSSGHDLATTFDYILNTCFLCGSRTALFITYCRVSISGQQINNHIPLPSHSATNQMYTLYPSQLDFAEYLAMNSLLNLASDLTTYKQWSFGGNNVILK